MSMIRLSLFFVLLSLPVPDRSQGEESSTASIGGVNLEFTQYGWPMTLTAKIVIPAEPNKVWRTLTDYDHLSDFLTGILSSRVLLRSDDKIVIEQTSETHFLFFTKKIKVRLNVIEKPLDEIAFYKIDGNMELFSGKWILQSLEEGKATRLIYMLKLKPAFFTPRWIVRHALDHEIPEQLGLISARALK